MTQIDIAALVADREAGTKGRLTADSGYLTDEDGNTVAHIYGAGGDGDRLANLRRFARLDDLDLGYIAQDAELKRYRELLAIVVEAADAHIACRDPAGDFTDWHNRARAALGEKP